MHTNDEKCTSRKRFLKVHRPSQLFDMDVLHHVLDNHETIMADRFIRSHIGDLLRSLRTQYLIDLIKPYTRLELVFLAKVSHTMLRSEYLLIDIIATQRRYA